MAAGAAERMKTSTGAQGNMEVEVWGMVTKAQEVARQLTEMTMAVPDQVIEWLSPDQGQSLVNPRHNSMKGNNFCLPSWLLGGILWS